MKKEFGILATVAVLMCLGLSALKDTPKDFEYKLSDIVRTFKLEIMNEDECEKQKWAAGNLAEEIKNAIENTDKYTSDEIVELKKLKGEAEALKEFIMAVGCGNYILSIKNFNLANERVGAKVVNLIKDKYCVNVITVSIGDYVAYFAENNSTNSYTVEYKWKSPIPNGMNTGNGTMGLWGLSVRRMYDNREKPSQKNISIFEIICN
jgi:hypothetical protein